jgi:hypothetical protein
MPNFTLVYFHSQNQTARLAGDMGVVWSALIPMMSRLALNSRVGFEAPWSRGSRNVLCLPEHFPPSLRLACGAYACGATVVLPCC